MSKKQLLAEARERGLIPKSGKGSRPNETKLRTLLGGKAKDQAKFRSTKGSDLAAGIAPETTKRSVVNKGGTVVEKGDRYQHWLSLREEAKRAGIVLTKPQIGPDGKALKDEDGNTATKPKTMAEIEAELKHLKKTIE